MEKRGGLYFGFYSHVLSVFVYLPKPLYELEGGQCWDKPLKPISLIIHTSWQCSHRLIQKSAERGRKNMINYWVVGHREKQENKAFIGLYHEVVLENNKREKSRFALTALIPEQIQFAESCTLSGKRAICYPGQSNPMLFVRFKESGIPSQQFPLGKICFQINHNSLSLMLCFFYWFIVNSGLSRDSLFCVHLYCPHEMHVAVPYLYLCSM